MLIRGILYKDRLLSWLIKVYGIFRRWSMIGQIIDLSASVRMSLQKYNHKQLVLVVTDTSVLRDDLASE